jgi:lysozyme
MNREQLRQDLIRHEGYKTRPYRCTEGKLTIGIGFNLEDNDLPREVIDLLAEIKMAEVEKGLAKELPWIVTRPEPVQRALANMAYQMGLSGLLEFKKMLAALQAGDYRGAKIHGLDSKWARQTPDRAKEVTDLFVAHLDHAQV